MMRNDSKILSWMAKSKDNGQDQESAVIGRNQWIAKQT
jgi:hypothetical protein